MRIGAGKTFDLGRTSVLNARLTDFGRVAGTYHGELVTYNGRLQRHQAHEGQLTALFVDVSRIVTGGMDGFLRIRSEAGKLSRELKVSDDIIYGVKKFGKEYIAIDGSGRVFRITEGNVERLFEHPEGRPAWDLEIVQGQIVVGFYDGTIYVLDAKGNVKRKIFRTLGDSVTFLSYDENLNAIIAGFRSGRISLIYTKPQEFSFRSGRSKRVVKIKPRTSVDLQTIGSVVRRAGMLDDTLMALGGNGTLYAQKLNKLLRAALSTRGTRIIARSRERLHDYGANGAHMMENTLITAGHDGYVKLRSVNSNEKEVRA